MSVPLTVYGVLAVSEWNDKVGMPDQRIQYSPFMICVFHRHLRVVRFRAYSRVVIVYRRMLAPHACIKPRHELFIFVSTMAARTILPHHINDFSGFGHSEMLNRIIGIPTLCLSDDGQDLYRLYVVYFHCFVFQRFDGQILSPHLANGLVPLKREDECASTRIFGLEVLRIRYLCTLAIELYLRLGQLKVLCEFQAIQQIHLLLYLQNPVQTAQSSHHLICQRDIAISGLVRIVSDSQTEYSFLAEHCTHADGCAFEGKGYGLDLPAASLPLCHLLATNQERTVHLLHLSTSEHNIFWHQYSNRWGNGIDGRLLFVGIGLLRLVITFATATTCRNDNSHSRHKE